MVKKLHPQPIYGPEDIGKNISLQALQSAITRACHDFGLPVEVTLDEMREGGMFSNKLPCILVRHKNYKTSYLQHVIVQKSLFNGSHDIVVYLAGNSRNLFKMGVGEEAYGQWGTRARIYGVTKGEVGTWLPSFGEIVLGRVGKKAAQKFHNQEKPYYERVEYAIGFAIGQAVNMPEPVAPPKNDDRGSKVGGGNSTGGGSKVGGNPVTGGSKVGGSTVTGGGSKVGGGTVTGGGTKVGGGTVTGGGSKVGGGASKVVTPPPQPKTPPQPQKHYSNKIIGIDLGTTNSCVAVLEGGEPVMIPGREGYKITPSVVAFSKDGKRVVGQAAKNQVAANPKRTVSSIKRQMGSAYRIGVDGQYFNPQQISAMILRKLKVDAENYLGENVKDAVITVPAYFTNEQRQATKDAGEIAGLNVVRIINEPTAAAMAYGLTDEKYQKVMVYDLGGGTFDVSILDMGDGVTEVLATCGDNHLGGDDFDRCLVDFMLDTFKKENGIDLFGDLTAMYRMKDAAEKAKIELSTLSAAKVDLPYLYNHNSRGPMHLSVTITRNQFNEMIGEMVQRTQEITRKALADANLTPADISKVLLVGGSTRIPAVQEAVKEVMGNKLVKKLNPDECVALGAAVQGGVLSGDVHNVTLLDVIPISLGLETKGGKFARILPKNTTIPTRVTRLVTTSEDYQSSVKISIYQGEEDDVSENKLLGHFTLGDIQYARQGVPQIQVCFDIDPNGILKVSAKDKATGKANSITISGSANMSRGDIDIAIREARNYESTHRMI